MKKPAMTRRRFLVAAAAAPAFTGCGRRDGFSGYAFVANEEGNAIAAVDLGAFAVARHIRLSASPTAVIAHPELPVVYALTPEEGAVHVIDASTLRLANVIRTGGPLRGMRLEPGGKAMWLMGNRKLRRIDASSLKEDSSISLPAESSEFDISEWTGLATTVHPTEGVVSVTELATGRLRCTTSLKADLGSVRFRSDGRSILVADRSGHMLTVLDHESGRVVVHLPLAVRPDHFCLHPDGGQLFITGEGRDAFVVVHPYFVPEVAETVLAGSQPGAMAASDTHLFVTNPLAGDVSIFSIRRRRLLAIASVGSEPSCVTLTPDNEYALVLNRKSGDMAVLDIAGLQPDRRRTAALFTMIPVGSRPVSAAVARV